MRICVVFPDERAMSLFGLFARVSLQMHGKLLSGESVANINPFESNVCVSISKNTVRYHSSTYLQYFSLNKAKPPYFATASKQKKIV